MNYGAMGFVIGHEITHGFDHTGRQLDKEGNHLDWWKPETKKNYLNRTECIINQYGNYTAEDVGINVSRILCYIYNNRKLFLAIHAIAINIDIIYDNDTFLTFTS